MSTFCIQIEDCRTRYNGDADQHQRRKKFTFPARLLCGDCFEVATSLKSLKVKLSTVKSSLSPACLLCGQCFEFPTSVLFIKY